MKVIKHGKKEFIGVCSKCGCQFEYTIDDLNTHVSITNGEVNCPDCGKTFHHKDQSVEDKLVMYDRPGMTPYWVTTSTDLPMQEIEVPKYDGEIFINENGVASDAIYWR